MKPHAIAKFLDSDRFFEGKTDTPSFLGKDSV
jgi:hypothetical protein